MKIKGRRWKQYIEELYQGYDELTDIQNSGNKDEQGETILRRVYNKSLKEIKLQQYTIYL